MFCAGRSGMFQSQNETVVKSYHLLQEDRNEMKPLLAKYKQ